jgi:hypothetical protein
MKQPVAVLEHDAVELTTLRLVEIPGLASIRLAAMAFVFLGCYAVINTCSQALWQSKVAAAVQGRVFAMRQMVALSALPLSRLVAGPLADKVFEPLLAPGGRLAGSLGRVLGVGPGHGIELLIIVLGLFNLLVLALAWSYPRLRLLEDEMPDLTTVAREAAVPA